MPVADGHDPYELVEEPSGQVGFFGDRALSTRVAGAMPSLGEISLKGGRAVIHREWQRQDTVTFVVHARCTAVTLRDVMSRDDPSKLERTVRVHEFTVDRVEQLDERTEEALRTTLLMRTETADLGEEDAAEIAARAAQLIEQDRSVKGDREPLEPEEQEQEVEVEEDWSDLENAPERRVICGACGELVEMEPVLDGSNDADRFVSGEEHGCQVG